MGRNTGCLSSHPTRAHLEVVVSSKLAGSGRGDATIDQDQLKPLGDSLTPEVVQHQFAGAVLVRGGRHDQRTHRETGHVDSHDPLGALGTAVGTAAVVEGEPAVGRAAGEVGVDDHHGGSRIGAPVRRAGGCVQHRQSSRPGAVAGPAAKL